MTIATALAFLGPKFQTEGRRRRKVQRLLGNVTNSKARKLLSQARKVTSVRYALKQAEFWKRCENRRIGRLEEIRVAHEAAQDKILEAMPEVTEGEKVVG